MHLVRRLLPPFRHFFSTVNKCQVRKCSQASEATSTYGYRSIGPDNKSDFLQARIILFGVWFWVFYRYFQSDSHETQPDPSLWTDEELGIPPDDDE